MLIGVDYYFCLFTNKVTKKLCGPVACETILGWVLSGHYSSKHCFSSCLAKYSMHYTDEQTLEENDNLKQTLIRFREIENLDLFDECVINQFEKDIVFNGWKYVTRLPFKEDHELLPDNFKTCQARLINLKEKLVD